MCLGYAAGRSSQSSHENPLNIMGNMVPRGFSMGRGEGVLLYIRGRAMTKVTVFPTNKEVLSSHIHVDLRGSRFYVSLWSSRSVRDT